MGLALPLPLPRGTAHLRRHRCVRELLRLDPQVRDRVDPALARGAVLLPRVLRQALARRPAEEPRRGPGLPGQPEPARSGTGLRGSGCLARGSRGADRAAGAATAFRRPVVGRVRSRRDGADEPALGARVLGRPRPAASRRAEAGPRSRRRESALRPPGDGIRDDRKDRPRALLRPVRPLRRHLGARVAGDPRGARCELRRQAGRRRRRDRGDHLRGRIRRPVGRLQPERDTRGVPDRGRAALPVLRARGVVRVARRSSGSG